MPGRAEAFRLPGGGVGILCYRPSGRKAPRCYRCLDTGRWQCDYQVRPGKTCDRFLCRRHRQGQPGNIDYCLEHARLVRLF